MSSDDPLVRNRRSWNAVVPAHESHRVGLAGFLRAGGSTLFPEEERLIGDVRGRSILHLQCNAGGDSLSLASRGASVTGVDLSDAAIAAARDLSRRTGIPATFVRADLYEWLKWAAREDVAFDGVFASYGVACWLADLDAWASGISAVLKPGGRFVLVDFHPAAETFDRGWRPIRDYPAGGERVALGEGVGDYVGDSAGGLTPGGFVEGAVGFENPEPATLYRWGLGEVVTAVAGAGLRVERLEEYPYANGERHFDGMREGAGRRMYPPEGIPAVPLMYGLRASRT